MSGRRAPIIAAAALALAGVLTIVLLVLPKMGQVSETNDQLQAAQDQEITLEAQLRALEQAQTDAPETEAAIAAIVAQVPPTADLPSIFRLLQGAADVSAVDFFSFTPGSPVADPVQGFSAIASQVTVTGSYFAIDEFLFQLETLPRAAKVTTIAVTPSQTGTSSTTTGSLQLQLTANFYTTDLSAGPGSVPGPTNPETAGV